MVGDSKRDGLKAIFVFLIKEVFKDQGYSFRHGSNEGYTLDGLCREAAKPIQAEIWLSTIPGNKNRIDGNIKNFLEYT